MLSSNSKVQKSIIRKNGKQKLHGRVRKSISTCKYTFIFSIYQFNFAIYFLILILRLQQFHSSMPKQQNQHYANDHESLNSVSVQGESYLIEEESSYDFSKEKYQQYDPKDRYILRKQKKKTPGKYYHWTPKENLSYKKFLEKNIKLLESDYYSRRVKRINVLMSQRIKTRSSNQCRSHHQKMIKHHKTVAGIIKFLEENFIFHSPPKIKLRTQQKELESQRQKDSTEQTIEDLIQEDRKINQADVETQLSPLIEAYPLQENLWKQIETSPLQEIQQYLVEVTGLYHGTRKIQDFFEPTVWWDGMDI